MINNLATQGSLFQLGIITKAATNSYM